MDKLTAELVVFFTAMIPFIDIKAAVPLGFQMGLSKLTIYFFAVAGMLIPGVLNLFLLGPVTNYARKKSKFLDIFFKKLFEKTRKDHDSKVKKFGPLVLLLFVGVPIPGSGAMTGALIAFVFGMESWTALTFIAVGTIVSVGLLIGGIGSMSALFHLFA
jgi:uncharacterized membrane protein